RKIDEERYTIRFTPRKPRSTWSAVNIKRMQELISANRATDAGIAAYEARQENRSADYSYEQRSVDLPPEYAKLLADDRRAFDFFQSQPPSYRKAATWWVVSAKKEETRLRRLQTLIEDSRRGERIAPLRREKPAG